MNKTRERYKIPFKFNDDWTNDNQPLSAFATHIEYILTTANSWKDGIRDFTLRINKHNPEEIISLCFPRNFKKVSDTILESHMLNFKPTKNLSIFFGNIEMRDCGNDPDCYHNRERDLGYPGIEPIVPANSNSLE